MPYYKTWLATLDGRTRHTHAALDGVSEETDKEFSNGCMYPGDPNGPPKEVYNCRCTLIADVDGVGMSGALRRDRAGLLPDMTYSQWENTKRGEGLLAADFYAKKESEQEKRDRKQFAEYKAILKENAPQSFAKFQDLKYNKPEKWEYTKALKSYLGKYPTSDYHYFDAMQELKDRGIKKGVLLPAVPKTAYILPSGSRDPYHIMRRMMGRGITDDQVRGYVTDARAMFVQWGGQRRFFVADNGMTIMLHEKDSDDWIFKTVWGKNDFDEESEIILEVLKKHGI